MGCSSDDASGAVNSTWSVMIPLELDIAHSAVDDAATCDVDAVDAATDGFEKKS